MCGICGIFSPAGAVREHDEVLPEMSRLMARRGPDDEGEWSDGRHAAFAFRRLAILDLSPAGHQPMTTPDGRFTLVFNGEVYNFRELRARLEGCGDRFRSSGDTEVVLRALARWGVDALPLFNGMFALACYDATERRLLLARDRAGIKPLYYHRSAHGIVFGSQYDQLLRHPWCRDAAVSAEGLALYLRFGTVPAPFGLLQGTAQLEAGAWLQADATGACRIERYWEFGEREGRRLQGDELVEALDAAVRASVRRHLVSDVPVGVFLSGGIDSPLVAAEAVRGADAPLKAFSIGVPGSHFDESGDARAYAAELGTEQYWRHASPDAALAVLPDVVAASTHPTAEFSMFPTLMVCGLARAHVTVALSGDGGDELFWGYPSRFGTAISLAPYFGRSRFTRLGSIAMRRVLGVGAASRDVLLPNVGRLYQKKHTLFDEARLGALFPTLSLPAEDFDLFACDATDADAVAYWTRRNEFRLHLERILQKVDSASMFHSLEVRVPLLDAEVMEVAAQADWRSCLDLERGVGKLPLRALLRRRLRHHTHAKRGFTVPMHAWLRGPLRDLLTERVVERDSFLGTPVDPTAVRDLDRRFRAGDHTLTWGLWLLLSLALWEDAHVRQQSLELVAAP